MWRKYRFLILITCLFSTSVSAANIFVDVLHWYTTEAQDWILYSNFSTPDQTVGYRTIDFDFKSGFRAGISSDGDWNTKAYITNYKTDAKDSATGQLVGVFLPAKIALPTGSYSASNIKFDIDYNIIDLEVSKDFVVSEVLTLEPIIGIKGGKIYQAISTDYTAATFTANERLKNNFIGVGPKTGLAGKVELLKKNQLIASLTAKFETAFLWGSWDLEDIFSHDTLLLDDISLEIFDRSFGSVEFQAAIGAQLSYKNLSASLTYEIYDWLNQNQIFDDGTGGHNNDLLLQGVVLGINLKI